MKYINFKKYDVIYFLVLIFLLFIPLIQYVIYGNMLDFLGRSSLGYMVIVSSLAISWIIAGQNICLYQTLIQNNKYLIYLLIGLVLAVMSTSFKDGPFVDYYYLRSIRKDEIIIQHLALTEPITFLAFMLLALEPKGIKKIINILLFIFIFLSLGGRTAFYCAILCLIIYEYWRNKTKFIFNISLIIIILMPVFIDFLSSSDNMFLNKLMFSKGVQEDESFQGRKEFLNDFFKDFLDQFLIGNPNALIIRHNDLGTYAHNLLSIIQFYGIGLFILTLYAFVYFFMRIKKLHLIKSNYFIDIFGILLLIYTFLSIIIGKSVLFPPLWFCIGFWSTRLQTMKRNK